MKSYLTIVVILLLSLGTAGIAAQAHPRKEIPRWRSEQCRFKSLDKPVAEFNWRELHLEVRCANHKWPVGLPMAYCIIAHESGWNVQAYNPSGAGGMFQFMQSTWTGAKARFLEDHPRWHLADRFNGRASAIVGIWYAHRNGWGAWTTAVFC